MQREVREPMTLLDEHGRLNAPGFARGPVWRFNPENIGISASPTWNRLRLKEWDYYGVTSRDWFFSATVANVGYIGLTFVYFIDFKRREMIDDFLVTPLGRGCVLPHESTAGDVAFNGYGRHLSFLRRPGERRLRVDWPRTRGGVDVRADLRLAQPDGHESIVMATPIGRRGFYHNEKINCMPATGEIRIGDRLIEVKAGEALGTLDWGRGVWAYSTFWNWASASGFLADGRTIGLNLGSGFGDLTHATENCLILGGKLHKLEWVDFEYDPENFLRPWRMNGRDFRLSLKFEPFFRRNDETNLGVLRTRANQMFGTYSGTVVADDGEQIALRNLVGWAEEHRARW